MFNNNLHIPKFGLNTETYLRRSKMRIHSVFVLLYATIQQKICAQKQQNWYFNVRMCWENVMRIMWIWLPNIEFISSLFLKP